MVIIPNNFIIMIIKQPKVWFKYVFFPRLLCVFVGVAYIKVRSIVERILDIALPCTFTTPLLLSFPNSHSLGDCHGGYFWKNLPVGVKWMNKGTVENGWKKQRHHGWSTFTCPCLKRPPPLRLFLFFSLVCFYSKNNARCWLQSRAGRFFLGAFASDCYSTSVSPASYFRMTCWRVI